MGSSFARRAGYIILSEESMQRSGAWLVRAGEPFRFPGEDIFLGKKIRPSALPAPLTPFGCSGGSRELCCRGRGHAGRNRPPGTASTASASP